MKTKLCENIASILLKGLGDDIKCPICKDDFSLNTIFMSPCPCNFIVCTLCFDKWDKPICMSCKSPFLKERNETQIMVDDMKTKLEDNTTKLEYISSEIKRYISSLQDQQT